MREFITDRSKADVERCKKLSAKGWNNMTDKERSEWYAAAMRGAYNHSDLNRVETAVAELSEFLELGLVTKTDWGTWDVPTHTDMNRYISNLQTIKERCLSSEEIPASMNGLTRESANNIEKMLSEAYENKDTHDVWQKSTATVEYVRVYTRVYDHPKIGTTGRADVGSSYFGQIMASSTMDFAVDKGFYGNERYHSPDLVEGYYDTDMYRTECRKITSTPVYTGYTMTIGSRLLYFYTFEYEVVGYATYETVPDCSVCDYLGGVLVPKGKLPEGTLIEGSYKDGYCYVKVGNDYYYYIRRT